MKTRSIISCSALEQEIKARQEAGISLQDGGLEEDYFVFTKLFFKKGYLSQEEFALCKRLYEMARVDPAAA